MISQILRFIIASVEIGVMFVVLTLVLIASKFAAYVAALAICFLGLVAAVTGRRVPRLRGRIKGISVFIVAGVFAFIAWQAHHIEQRETRWAELRKTAPDTYLEELQAIDQDRWLEELSELRPERYAEETERREAELQAQREAEAAETALSADAEVAVQVVTEAPASATAQRLIASSDDLDENRAVFGRVANELVTNGTCTEAEFIANGGWLRSTTFEPRPVYFMYCGGSTVADRLYLDAATGKVFRGTDGLEISRPDGNGSEQAVERLAQCENHEAEAYVMIKADVRRVLIAPSTARFPWRFDAGTGHLGDCLYRVNGHFDAQNGFGAMLRSTFTGTIRYFPQSGSWQTQSLSIN
ncbi:hypothetical protein SAMN04488044_1835 [Cognatishimia maritima]|uniref:Uncharacterized protein n=1 Tax=Cognatishimia maritima TaxID=870908 RepID=A0A1M5PJF9_9RHOB|nr:hypothetical protein SAMN04488044_1835 [Cognatishimia maritima]